MLLRTSLLLPALSAVWLLQSQPLLGAPTTLVECDFTGTTPGLMTPWKDTSALDGGVTFAGWSLGPGATGVGAYEIDEGFKAADDLFGFHLAWALEEKTLDQTIADDDYINCVIEPKDGGSFNLNGALVEFDIQRLEYWAPRRYAMFSSLDGFASGQELLATPESSFNDYAPNSWSVILPTSGFDAVAEPVEFRIFGFEGRYGKPTSLTKFKITTGLPIASLSLEASTGGSAATDTGASTTLAGATLTLLATPEPGFRFAGWSGDLVGLGNPRQITMNADKNVTANFEPVPDAPMQVGTNLAEVVDWSTSWQFVDLFRRTRIWLTRNGDGSGWESGYQDQIPVDENGWPTEVPFDPGDGNQPQIVFTVLARASTPGDYTLLADGSGRLELDIIGGSSHTLSPGEPSLIFTIPEADTFIAVVIKESAAPNHLRNIRIVPTAFVDGHEDAPFHSTFLEKLFDFSVLRFMDWGRTNGSPVESWNDRTRPEHYTQSREEGVSWEMMADLSNRLKQDAWVCIPARADDDYVRRSAQLLRDQLDPTLKLYVEYSNETWNSGFPQTDYVQDQGELLGLDPNRWTAGQKFTALRSAQVWKIFEEELGPEAETRLVKVLGTQSANMGITNTRMDAINDPVINVHQVFPDALALAPYFGKGYHSNDIPPAAPAYPTLDEILDVVAPTSITELRDQIRAAKALANEQGLQLICYEGGQHFVGVGGANSDDTLTDILVAANRDARMHGLYQDYLTMLQEEGIEMFCNFTFSKAPGRSGSWGILEAIDQPDATAHKFTATRDWISENPPAQTRLLWGHPEPITYGSPLTTEQLDANAGVVPGSFEYSLNGEPLALGQFLPAGEHLVTCVFTPESTLAVPAQVEATITVTQAPLTIRADNQSRRVGTANPTFTATYEGWANGDTTLAEAPSMTTTATIDSEPGSYPIMVTGGSDPNYAITRIDGTLTVLPRDVPTITWNEPDAIVFGEELGEQQLNASSEVAGAFAYSPAAGTRLEPGEGQVLSVTFTPEDLSNYEVVSKSVTIDVNRAIPTLSWDQPTEIVFGTPLGPIQLNASTSVAGTFAYTPPSGTVLDAGDAQVLSATFTPNEIDRYEGATMTAYIDVKKAAPTIVWNKPAGITYGTPLGSAQLNALSPAPGELTYAPEAGTVLGAGLHTLSVTLAQSKNYLGASNTVEIEVARAPLRIRADDKTRTVGLPNPTLTATYSGFVNGDASIESPPSLATTATASSVLGQYPITVSGSSDPNYSITEVAGTLTVAEKELPVITWETPAPITFGTKLGEDQLNATANVSGTFAYLPPAGTQLNAGADQLISVTFTPDDTDRYTSATESVTVDVRKATASIAWEPPEAITYGTAIGKFQLNATSSAPGTLLYDPPAGAVLRAGTAQTLSVLLPESENYLEADAEVTIDVQPAELVIAAVSATRKEGESNPAFAAIFTGFVNEDSVDALVGNLELSTSANEQSIPGTYEITVGGVSSPDYSITFVPGTLTIEEREAEVPPVLSIRLVAGLVTVEWQTIEPWLISRSNDLVDWEPVPESDLNAIEGMVSLEFSLGADSEPELYFRLEKP